jgi:hypothetical protein
MALLAISQAISQAILQEQALLLTLPLLQSTQLQRPLRLKLQQATSHPLRLLPLLLRYLQAHCWVLLWALLKARCLICTLTTPQAQTTVTVAVAVNGILSTAAADTAGSFGDLTIAAGATGVGRFTIMFSSATAYVFTRTA